MATAEVITLDSQRRRVAENVQTFPSNILGFQVLVAMGVEERYTEFIRGLLTSMSSLMVAFQMSFGSAMNETMAASS